MFFGPRNDDGAPPVPEEIVEDPGGRLLYEDHSNFEEDKLDMEQERHNQQEEFNIQVVATMQIMAADIRSNVSEIKRLRSFVENRSAQDLM